MDTIQQSIKDLVIPRVETLVKNAVVIGNEHGQALLTALGQKMKVSPTQVSFTLHFKCSYVDEWIGELARVKTFPFLWVNAKGITYDGDVCTIPEMLLCTLTDERWTAEQKDGFVLDGILKIIHGYLEDTFQCFYGTDSGFSLRYERLYNAKLQGQGTAQTIDAILIKQTKVRILKHCEL